MKRIIDLFAHHGKSDRLILRPCTEPEKSGGERQAEETTEVSAGGGDGLP